MKSKVSGQNRPPDLFSFAADSQREPLAERMRPRSFKEFVGQAHAVGDGKLPRRAIETGHRTSIILHGPPGTGKTTIANIIAHETKARFVTVNAVLDGVKELRDVVDAAQKQFSDERTLPFVDEIHRWNKAQQDALLPHVEAGTVILVGATTENPSFEVNAPLLSRAKVLVLKQLSEENLRAIIDRALADPDRGLGREPIDCPAEV